MISLTFLYELQPKYDNRKSFYHKAKVYTDNNGTLYLKSYETIVAKLKDPIITDTHKKEMIIHGWYSQTTSRHINEFLLQNGYKAISKKDIEKLAEDNKSI